MKYVVTGMDGGANLRPVPTLTAVPAEKLKFATLLDEIAPSATKWKHVRVIDGPRSGKTGHVYFAIVHSEGALRLLKAEAFNWEDSVRGKGEEGDDGSGTSPNGPDYKQKVLDMWDALCGGRPPGNNTSHDDWPWSAAGTSAFVRKAKEGGSYADFQFSNGHDELLPNPWTVFGLS